MKQDELNELIDLHEKWINSKGKQLYLWNHDLSNLDFSNRDLRNAYFYECNLENANFSESDLTNVSFKRCDNLETIITDENTLPKIYCPEIGEFMGYKKCRIRNTKNKFYYDYCIVKLLIPEDAKRISGTGNKCRCSKAKILGFYDYYGNKIELDDCEKIVSIRDSSFEYKLNEYVYPDYFDEFRWNECTHGIHFYMTFEEATNN